MLRPVIALAALVAAILAPPTTAAITNVSPAEGTIVSTGEAVTFSWSTNNLVSPVFGSTVAVVVTGPSGTVLDQATPCPAGGERCPTEATAGPFPAGAYTWYVRFWVFHELGPYWDSSAPTTFTVAAPPPPPPPPPPAPPPGEPSSEPITVPARVSPPERCGVPRLAGMSVVGARSALLRAHCRLGAVGRAYSTSPRGSIVRQALRPGSAHLSGTRVDIVVSRGRR